MKQRNIWVVLLLSVVTFGFYAIYWNCAFQNELKKETGLGFGWLGHLLMSFVTFGIYPLYWQYAAGKRLAKLGAEDRSIIYIVLTLLGVGAVVNPLLMQDQANKLSK